MQLGLQIEIQFTHGICLDVYPRYIVVISDDRSVAGVCVGDGVGGGQWRGIMLGNLLAEQVVQLRGRPVSGRSRYNGSVFCL